MTTTANANIRPLVITEVEELCVELGLTLLEQTSFYKIAVEKKAIYVSKTKKCITRIDISGFEVPHVAIVAPVKKNGKVTGQLMVSHPDAREALVEAFEGLTDRAILGSRLLLGAERLAFEAASKK